METIGQKLKKAREARKLTIKQVVAIINVRAHYLQAMEMDDYSTLPSAAQARGFLRLYAEFLGLDAEEIIARYREENNQPLPPPAQVPVQAAPIEENPPPAPRMPEIVPEPDEEPAAPESPRPSQVMLMEIGALLHERRELISLTLDEVERHTRIRKHNLELIENGNFEDLPSPVQARGILNAYAAFMDMDTEAVLLRYADALQARRLERQPEEAPASAPRARQAGFSWLARFISPDLLFGGGMIVLLLGLSIWWSARVFSTGTGVESTPTQGPSISDVLLATSAPGTEATQAENFPTSAVEDLGGTPIPTQDPALIIPTETAMPTVFSAVQVTVIVRERTFLRVIVDGEIQQDGRPPAGTALTFDGNERVEVLTGSGSGIQIIFNQTDLGIMGSFGEVVNRIYTVTGVETPTPTASPTPSITPRPSRTPRPSATPRPNLTPRATPTIRP